jgi:hypothetical protein
MGQRYARDQRSDDAKAGCWCELLARVHALAKAVADIHESKGRTPAEARDLVIRELLSHGDAGPFLAWSGEGVGPEVLELIATMLRGDAGLPYRLVIKRAHQAAHATPRPIPGRRGPVYVSPLHLTARFW